MAFWLARADFAAFCGRVLTSDIDLIPKELGVDLEAVERSHLLIGFGEGLVAFAAGLFLLGRCCGVGHGIHPMWAGSVFGALNMTNFAYLIAVWFRVSQTGLLSRGLFAHLFQALTALKNASAGAGRRWGLHFRSP